MLKERKLSELYLYLFIAVLVGVVSSALTSTFESDFIQDLMNLIGLVAAIAEVVLVFVLSNHNENFKKAFILIIIASIGSFILSSDIVVSGLSVGVLVSIFSLDFSGLLLALFVPLIITIAIVVVELVATYYVFSGHSEILTGIDDTLAAKWKKLFDWRKIATIAMVAGIVVLFLIDILGILIVILAGIDLIISIIGLFVVQCLEIYYLYKTHEVLGKDEEKENVDQ